eukprot:6176091-Pleurochrysis_carterae.AAC.1
MKGEESFMGEKDGKGVVSEMKANPEEGTRRGYMKKGRMRVWMSEEAREEESDMKKIEEESERI